MSTLQISLAVAGGLVLAAVVAHAAWSARKNQPKRPTPEPGGRDSVMGPASVHSSHSLYPDSAFDRREPSLGADADAAVDSGMASLTALTAMMTPDKKPGLDALIDVIALIAIEHPVSGDAALAAMPGTRRVGSKPFAVEGLSTSNGEWEIPATHKRYSAFQCGVQLANRLGPLNQIEYSEFVMKTQAFADAVGGEPEFPEMRDEVSRARELDNFASAHDAQLSFTLRAVHTAWSPGYVQQSAARIGFVPGSMPGRMVLPASQQGDAHVLGLTFDTHAALADDPEQTALRQITLSLDVPHVPRTERPFVRMRQAAMALAASMDGAIIDDNGNLIHLDAMDLIGAELEQLYDVLDQRELSAGSALARRLFS